MENLNIDQYLNKVDGNTLPASEWNACLTAVQTKVNELVGAVSNGITMSTPRWDGLLNKTIVDCNGIELINRENPQDNNAPVDYCVVLSDGIDVHSGLSDGGTDNYVIGMRFMTDRGLELVKINTGEEYDGAYWGESAYGENSTIRLDIDGSGAVADGKIRWDDDGNIIAKSIKPANGITGQFVIGNNTFTFTNGILTNVA